MSKYKLYDEVLYRDINVWKPSVIISVFDENEKYLATTWPIKPSYVIEVMNDNNKYRMQVGEEELIYPHELPMCRVYEKLRKFYGV